LIAILKKNKKMVTLESIIDVCKRKDYDAMPIKFPFELMAPLILMYATHEAYEIPCTISLKDFDKQLTGGVGKVMSLYSLVNLGDFLQAYYLAMDVNAVNDPCIAAIIATYVSKHVVELAPFLKQDEVPKEFKEECIKAFPCFNFL
jgi:hypothetical protein